MNISSFYAPLPLPRFTRKEKANLAEARELIAGSDSLSRPQQFAQAMKALDRSLYCVEAYNLLAEADVNMERRLYIYQRAEEAGRALLGENFLQKRRGRLLLYPEATPYLQALAGIAAWHI